MIDLFRDPIWQFVGAAIAIFAIIVSVYIFLLQRNKKSLAYDLLLNVPLLTKKEGLEGRVQILFDDNLVENIHLVAVRISNEGNVPILPTDFIEHLEFNFGENNEILGAEVSFQFPPRLNPKISSSGNCVKAEPLLLNSGDSFEIKLLLSQPVADILASARVVGVSNLKKLSGKNRFLQMANIGLLLTTLAGISFMLLGVLAFKLTPPEDMTRQLKILSQLLVWIIPVAIIGIGGIFLTVVSFRGQSRLYNTHYSIPESFKSQKGSSSDW